MATPDPKELQRLINQLNEVEKRIAKISGEPITIRFDGESDPEKIAQQFGGVDKAIKAITTDLRRAENELASFSGTVGTVKTLIEEINTELKTLPNAFKKSLSTFKKIEGVSNSLAYNQSDLANMTEKDIERQKARSDQYFQQLRFQKEGLKAQISAQHTDLLRLKRAAQADGLSKTQQERAEKAYQAKKEEYLASRELLALAEGRGTLEQNINDTFDDQIQRIKNMNSGLGLSGGIIEGIGAGLGKLGFSSFSSSIEEAKDKMKELSVKLSEGGEKTVGFAGKLKVLGAGLASLGKSLKSALTDPLAIIGGLITAIVKQFNHIDKVASNIGKTMGMTRQASLDMAADLKKAGKESGDIFLNMDRMVNAQLRINEAMGTRVRMTNQQLADNARLVELAGFSEQQAQGMLNSSILTGKSQEELYNTTKDTNDSIYSTTSLLKEASEITGQMAMLNGNNVTQIARGVAAAKRMGINMATARDMAMGTLDFESSIRAEMELAAITGKRINLNKARELAFQGKFNQAAAEILKQEAVREAFQSGNVIAQRKAAEAAGLSVDQLAEAYNKQVVAFKLRQRQNAVMAELEAKEKARLNRELTAEEKIALRREANLRDLRENQTFGEKINNLTTKLGDLLGTVVGPAVDYIGDGLDIALQFFAGLLGKATDTTGQTAEMDTKLSSAVKFGQSLSDKFQSAKDFVLEMKDKLAGMFENSPILTTLGAIAGGTLAIKGLGKVKNALGFGKLGTSGNPMHVTMSEGGGLVNSIKNLFGGKNKRGKGNMLQRMMGTFKMPKMTGLGNIAKGAGKLLGGAGRIAGKAFLPLAAAMSVFDGVKGFTADPDAALGDKLKNAGSSILNGLTFGLLGKSPDEINAEAQSQGVAAAQEIPAAQVQAATGQVAPATSLPPMPATDDTNELLRHLIQVVSAGGDVIMDGRKVGSTLQMASFKL